MKELFKSISPFLATIPLLATLSTCVGVNLYTIFSLVTAKSSSTSTNSTNSTYIEDEITLPENTNNSVHKKIAINKTFDVISLDYRH